MANVVEILIRAKNMAGPAMDEAAVQSETLGKKLSKVGMATGLAFAAIGYESVKMAATFQQSMTRLVTQAGVPQRALGGLSKGVLNLAGQVGESPDSLAQALFHVMSTFESTGITGAKAMSLLKVAAEGARLGGADLVDVQNALDATIRAGIPGVHGYGQAMGALNAIVGTGDMTMQNLAEAMGTGAVAIAKTYGQSITQVGAALATFGDNNIRGAHAATMLRMAWQAMAAPAKAGAADLAQLGLSQTSLYQTMTHHGLSSAVGEFIGRLKASHVPVADWGQYITTIFGKKAGAGIAILVSQFGTLESKFPKLKEAMGGFGGAWAQQQKTLSQQVAQLRGAFDALMITIGTKLIPVVKSVVEWMLKHKAVVLAVLGAVGALGAVLLTYLAISRTVNAATSLWNDLQKVGAGLNWLFATSVDAETGAVTGFGLATKLAAAGQWLLNIAMDANPIGLIIIAVAAFIAVIVLLWTHCKGFRDFIKGAWNDIKKWTGELVQAMKLVWDIFWKWMKGKLDEIGKFFQDGWHRLCGIVDWAVGYIRSSWNRMYRYIIDPIKHAFDVVMGWFHTISAWLDSLGSRIDSMGGGIVGWAAHHMGLAAGGVVGAASGGPRSGLVMVGERGRELVRLPAGSRVMNNAQTERAMAGGHGGGVLQIEWVGDRGGDALLKWIRESIRIRGGSVQTVLGS